MKSSPTAVALWSELKKYLESDTKVSGENIQITISNVAPLDKDLPLIVFTGLALAIKDAATGMYASELPRFLRGRGRDGRGITVTPPENEHKYRYKNWTGGRTIEELTEGEASLGIALFPGEKATIAFSISAAEVPNYKFSIDGNVSRRYFFRISQPIDLD